MRQKTFILKTIDDFKKQIPEIKREFDESTYSSGYVTVCYGNTPENEVRDVLFMLKENFPKLAITGMSEGTVTMFYQMEKILNFEFCFFDDAKAEVFYKIFEPGASNYEQSSSFVYEVRDKLAEIDNIKAIQILLARVDAVTAKFIDKLSEGHEDVPIYGAVASSNFPFYEEGVLSLNNGDAAIVGDTEFGPGISICVVHGESIQTYVEYEFGWEPIGRALDVEFHEAKEKGSIQIEKIDGQRAADVYKKYLGVTAGPYFVGNVGAFPLALDRDGLSIGRTPSAIGKDGEVILEGDLLPGEKIRFSYGEKRDILRKTREAVARMQSFDPESLTLVICGNRFAFLEKDYRAEVDYFAEGRETFPGISLGMGEIYKYKGKGGVLNSALIAVGMREGSKTDFVGAPKTVKEEAEPDGIIPLHERLAHFLTAMTGELVEAAREADAANEAKSSFLSNMSHEIRTPINAILGMDEVILREADDPHILEYAENIRTAGNTLLGLINDILDFSKIEAGKMDIIPVEYDPASIVNDLVQMIAPRAKAKGLELKLELNSELPSILNGDEIRLKQVVSNILTNAVKYTEKGSITLSGSFEYVSDDEIDVTICVKDTGIGIKEEDLKKLYGAFQRVDEKRNRNIEGTGLGLNITQRILNLMGSELKVKSTYGEGSEFSFTVRQKVVQKEPVGDYFENYNRSVCERQTYRERFTAPEAEVLVVDDTPTNLTVFEGLLKKTKVRVSKADSGATCLEMTGQKKYDIVFLDHRMPIMDGIETLKRLKADPDNKNRNTPTICLTANAVSGAREHYIESGFDDYLTKPIISEKLEAMMIEYLPEEKVTRIETDADDGGFNKNDIPEWIRNIPGISVEDGIRHCGSSDSYIEAVNTFKDTAADNYEAIKGFYENEDIENYTIKVHALKSSSRIIGLKEISGLSAALEEAGDVKDMDTIGKDTPRLLSMFEMVNDHFSQVDKQADNRDRPLMDEVKLKDAIESLKEVAATFDFDSIRYIMETINEFRVPDDHKVFFEKLRKAVMAANWDEINRLLQEGGKDG